MSCSHRQHLTVPAATSGDQSFRAARWAASYFFFIANLSGLRSFARCRSSLHGSHFPTLPHAPIRPQVRQET